MTNIDNFPVEQVVFSLSGGYDSAVRPLLSTFEPIIFPVGNDLWIVTQDNPLPAGFNAREWPASQSVTIDDGLPAREPVNALLVHLKDNGTGEYFTEELETRTEVAGTFGTPGYTVTDVERRVRKYRNFAAPLIVTRQEEVYLQRRVLDYQFNEISIETHTFNYDALNRPSGYTRTVKSLLPDAAGVLTLQTSRTETQTITYAPHPLNPARDVQDRIETLVSGLILTDNDTQYLDKPYKIPLADAHKSGYVNKDADQDTVFGALSTITETIRVQGGQVFRDRHVVNHVSNVEEAPITQVVPGDASFDRRRESGRTRTVLLTVPGSDANSRRVAEFDATSLPAEIGMRLGQKRLARLNSPPRAASIEVPYIDVGVRRGSDLKVYARSGALGTYIVRGYQITLERNSEGVVEGKMNLSARELR